MIPWAVQTQYGTGIYSSWNQSSGCEPACPKHLRLEV